ncbi:MAG TPA: nicotinate phosphoribosyltransferase [bacterium]|nr:nicotinate phosphoribosyltransferase [bacterium]HOL47740.1 nicotinate phosphoribosyltransferase [bacterium]HPQ18026.1 nicotinate phosphoribosyltransferase [bacterium]
MKFKQIENLNPLLFKLPVNKLRNGYFSDKDCVSAKDVLFKENNNSKILMEFSVNSAGVACGIEEAVLILKLCTGYYRDSQKAQDLFENLKQIDLKIRSTNNIDELKELNNKKLEITAELNNLWEDKSSEITIKCLNDGDRFEKGEPILIIEGIAKYFIYLETVIQGVLTRGTSIATAVDKIISVSNNKPILFYSARYDHFLNQTIDGYAAIKAGAFGVSTEANAYIYGVKSIESVSNTLIGCYEGLISDAAFAYDKATDNLIKRIIVVSWNNDSINDAIKLVNNFYNKYYKKDGKKLSDVIGSGRNKIWAVRFDNLINIRDFSVTPINSKSLGTSAELIWLARKKFDEFGLNDLKIVASGGFDYKKIKLFEQLKVPVDIYGVGSYIVNNKLKVSCEIIMCNSKLCARTGIIRKDSHRLKIR